MSPEQAYRFSIFMKFNSLEKTYWLLLLDYDKATSAELKKFIEECLDEAKSDYDNDYRIRHDITRTPWSDDFVAIFFSSWHFGAIYCIFATQKNWSAEEVSQRLNIPLSRTRHVLDCFVDHQIVTRNTDHRYQLSNTKFVQFSPGSLSHKAAVLHNHKSFRNKAMSVAEDSQLEEIKDPFFATTCLAISTEDYLQFKEDIKSLIDGLYKRASGQTFEQIVCLNIDYFKL